MSAISSETELSKKYLIPFKIPPVLNERSKDPIVQSNYKTAKRETYAMESSKIYPGTLKFSLIILALCLFLFLAGLVSITAIPSAGSVWTVREYQN
jgi:hypothetical protein